MFCGQPLMSRSANAQGMGMHGMGGMHDSFMSLLRSANLSAGQKSQVQQILQSDRGQMHSLHQQFAALHEQMAAKLLSPGRVSSSDLKPLLAQASRLQEQINENMLDTALSIRSVLSPEQLGHLAQVHQQLATMHKQLQGLMGHGNEEMGEDSPN